MTTSYLFGYGSILWRQDFVPIRTMIGTLRGYSRVINQASTDHRGTVHRPGAVASLRTSPQRFVVGKLFEIAPSDQDRVFEKLDVREQNGYSLIPISVEVGEAIFEAVTYIALLYGIFYLFQTQLISLFISIKPFPIIIRLYII